MADLWEYIKTVARHWVAGVTGGLLAVAMMLSGVFHPFPRNIVLGGLLGYVLLASYYAWKEERRKVYGKNARAILTGITDRVHHRQIYKHGMLQADSRFDVIEGLINASDDFNNEGDVEWVCRALDSTSHSDPFVGFELNYGQDAFKGKRLKFLRDARISGHEIKTDSEALHYIRAVWGDANGLVEL